MSAPSSYQRVVLFALWIVLALCPFRLAHADNRVQFDIPSGPAGTTLPQYIAQTGLQVVFGYDDVRGISTNEIHGEFDVADALVRMTKGTRLRFEFITADAVTITVMPPPRAARGGADTHSVVETPGPAVDRPSLSPRIDTITVSTRQDQFSVRELGGQMIALTGSDLEGFGFRTAQDAIRTLPQIFGGGPTEDTHIGSEARTNAASGTGVNLRGLDAGSTLVLVNGRRLASGGSDGVFVDISSLPLSAIKRIEILPDSSSSLYGADAVGGVVNFILRDSFDGAQTIASYGAATHGALSENQISHIMGVHPKGLDAVLAFDFYSRDALAAADRRLARSDLRAFGGTDFDTLQSNPATISVGSSTWAVPRGQDGSHLDAVSLIPDQQNKENRYDQADLLPSQQRWSFYGSGKTNFSNRVQLFADTLFSERDVRNRSGGARTSFLLPMSNPFYIHPSTSPAPVVVNYNFARDLGPLIQTANVRTVDTIGGVNFLLGDAWRMSATADFAAERLRAHQDNSVNSAAFAQALADPHPETAFNPFGDGSYTNPETLERIRGSQRLNSNSELWSGDLAASRDLPGFKGTLSKLVMGVDYRRQAFASDTETSGALQTISRNMHRTAQAAFATLAVPLLGKRTEDAELNQLEISIAERYERYSDFGHVITPRYAMTWAPVRALALRGTWSSSFRPPNLMDLDESSNFISLFGVQNPQAPTTQTLVLVQSGNNAGLREERAGSWTLGLDLHPVAVPGFAAALTYFDTTFTDRRNSPLATTALLTDPFLASRVTLNPTPEQRLAICNSALYVSGLAPSCLTTPIAGIVDLRLRNSARVHTNGIDLLAQYTHDSDLGTVTYKMNGSYTLSFAQAESPGRALQERVSTQNNPIDLRLTGSLDWQRGPFRTTAFLSYLDGYRDIASTPHRSVRSWMTLDLDFSYTLSRQGSGPLSGVTLSLNAENAFAREAPFLNNAVGIGYDQENSELTGRVVSINMRKNW